MGARRPEESFFYATAGSLARCLFCLLTCSPPPPPPPPSLHLSISLTPTRVIKVECRDMKTYYFTVARGATRAADAALLQGIRRFEDEIAWLIEEDNFAHSVRESKRGQRQVQAQMQIDAEGTTRRVSGVGRRTCRYRCRC